MNRGTRHDDQIFEVIEWIDGVFSVRDRVEIVNAHPRIGADVRGLSVLSCAGSMVAVRTMLVVVVVVLLFQVYYCSY